MLVSFLISARESRRSTSDLRRPPAPAGRLRLTPTCGGFSNSTFGSSRHGENGPADTSGPAVEPRCARSCRPRAPLPGGSRRSPRRSPTPFSQSCSIDPRLHEPDNGRLGASLLTGWLTRARTTSREVDGPRAGSADALLHAARTTTATWEAGCDHREAWLGEVFGSERPDREEHRASRRFGPEAARRGRRPSPSAASSA